MKILVIGFLSVIVLGAVLLWLPVSNEKPISFLDALFTSTTSVCVTGLVTVVPKYQFTIMGKIILLILIQIGGLGIIACITAFFMLLKRKITVKERIVIQEAYNMNSLGGLVGMVRRILFGTVVVEGIGAVFYAIQFSRDYGLVKGIWYGVFHSVSAFCNAGIDILGANSLEGYQADPYINLVTILLIIVSGLGFLVWRDLTLTAKRIWKKEYPVGRALQKMRLHTKLALSMTGFLLIIGTVAIFAMEYTNPRTLGTMTTGQKWIASLFQAVTTRTAGFFTIPQDHFLPQSQLLSCMLMFIGGSPGGTAGGVKTTTVAILAATCWSVLKGSEDTECFRRKILPVNIRTGFSVAAVSFSAVLIGTMAILILEHTGLIEALYEVVSAVGTVGLTAGLTPSLSSAGKCVIILLMYMGRLSPVTLALLFAGKMGRRGKGRKLPEERIMVG